MRGKEDLELYKISKNKISITRGDSAYLDINIFNEDGTAYTLHDGDTVQAQVRTEPNIGELLIDASLENGKIYVNDNGAIVWHIFPADTRNLEIGTYSYDVQIVTADGDVFTFIEDSDFRVTNEVTWHE
mgnify:CR=1 FL=1